MEGVGLRLGSLLASGSVLSWLSFPSPIMGFEGKGNSFTFALENTEEKFSFPSVPHLLLVFRSRVSLQSHC